MVINIKNPLPNIKGRKIIAIALAGIVVSGVGGYVLLAGGPPLNANALSINTPAAILPANVPPPMVAPVGSEPVPMAQPAVAGADQAQLQQPPINAQTQPLAASPVSVPVAVAVPPQESVPAIAANAPPSPVPVAAVVPVAPVAQAVTPKPNIAPANPIAAAKVDQQVQAAPVAKAPELGAKPAPVNQSVTNAEIMAKLDSMSRELRETRSALAGLQDKMRDVKKPQPVQAVPVRQVARKAAVTEERDAPVKAASVQEIRPGARLANGEIVSKITAEGAVTNTGRVIHWGEQ